MVQTRFYCGLHIGPRDISVGIYSAPDSIHTNIISRSKDHQVLYLIQALVLYSEEDLGCALFSNNNVKSNHSWKLIMSKEMTYYLITYLNIPGVSDKVDQISIIQRDTKRCLGLC